MKYFTQQWFDLLQVSDTANDPKVDDPPREYLQMLKKQNIPAEILDKLDFHDSEVLKIEVDSQALMLELEEREWGCSHLHFEKPEILKMDDGILGSEWLYEEIYREGRGYEMHVLFYSRKALGLKELILRCEDIVIK